MRCPACGTEYEDGASFCPEDQTRLVIVGGAEEPDYLSPTPMMVCTDCGAEYPTGARVCDPCGRTLRFLHGRSSCGVFLNDRNPERICPECGRCYAAGLDYCCNDGARLVALN